MCRIYICVADGCPQTIFYTVYIVCVSTVPMLLTPVYQTSDGKYVFHLGLPASACESLRLFNAKLNEPGGNILLSAGDIMKPGGAVCECMLLSMSSSLFELKRRILGVVNISGSLVSGDSGNRERKPSQRDDGI